MKSITIHNLDDQVDQLIKNRASAKGLSLNKTIKGLLRSALGISPKRPDHREEFAELCGVLPEDEARELLAAVAELRTVNDEEWL